MADIGKKLVTAIKAAAKDKRKLALMGANTKSFIGREIVAEPLSLLDHSGILEYQPDELVLKARAGTRISEVVQALEGHHQMLPFDPPIFDGDATLGGTLACNISGPARPWRGASRDSVLGVRIINGMGEHLRFGGQVLKNVAGYDITRLQAGALGTLGAITEVTFRVLPRPVAKITLMRQTGASDAISFISRARSRPSPLTGAAWVEDKLFLRLEGSENVVARAFSDHSWDEEYEEHSIWGDIRDQKMEFFTGGEPIWRFCVDSGAEHRLQDQPWLIDWGGAQRWLRGSNDKEKMEALAGELRGHVSLFRNGDRNSEVFHTLTRPVQELQLRLKNAFDPYGILNPGRMYSWM
jgi:glycolate oxidase FAD binding subunit